MSVAIDRIMITSEFRCTVPCLQTNPHRFVQELGVYLFTSNLCGISVYLCALYIRTSIVANSTAKMMI